jgi:signal transduction histidine kinase
MDFSMLAEVGLVATTVICIGVALDTARATAPPRRRLPVVLFATAVAAWSTGEFMVWHAASPEGVLLARRILYAGTGTLGVTWFLAAADAAQVRGFRVTPFWFAAMSAPLVAAWLLLFSDHAPLFIHGSARPPVFGPLFWPYIIYLWALSIAGFAGFVVAARRLGKADPMRIVMIAAGGSLPIVGNFAILLSGADGVDLTPIGAGISAVLIRLSVFDAGLAGFLPVARRDVIEQLDAGVIVADLDGIVVTANAAAVQLVGNGALVGRHLEEVLTAAGSDPARTLEVRRAAVRGRLGVVGSFALLTDRSEARRTERQLLLAHKLEALGVLTAGIAHEVNNPLAFVRSNLAGLVELTEGLRDPRVRGRLPEKLAEIAADAPELLADAIEGVERIGRLVRRLRTFARDGDAVRELVPIDLCEVARKARSLAGVGLTGDTIRCVLQPVPHVLGVEDELVQIAVNLVANAVQASGAAPDIEIEVAPHGSGATLVVRDRGPGIPPEVLPRLFDPFFTTKEPGQGTGLGLSLSFDLARRFDGHLEARSRPGGGAELELWLPGTNG